MSAVAKSKPKPDEPKPGEEQPALAFPLRFPEKYAWVVAALDAVAEEMDQSRNMAIVLLLRDAVAELGHAPPD